MRTATVNGTTLAYSDAGDGLLLLCVHGGMGVDGNTLRVPGILDLVDHGIRVVVPDLRGHGGSASCPEHEYSHLGWATDLHALVERLGDNAVALLGHSYGGFIALEYAVRWPQSLTHLVLVATSAGPVDFAPAVVDSDAALREHFRAIWPRFFLNTDKHWPLFDRLQIAAAPYNAAFQRELPAYDVRERVAAVQVPTLLIVGSDDRYRPDMEWLADQMPHADLWIVEHVGHFPFIEAASEFTSRVAAFLNERRIRRDATVRSGQ